MLFPAGERPDLPTIRQIVDQIGAVTISAEPAVAPNSEALKDELWVELLCEGMTFDLCGLAGGHSTRVPDLLDPSDLCSDRDMMEAVELKLGPHLAAGGHNLPIVRAMLAVATTLAGKLDKLVAISWPASGTCLSPSDFSNAIDSWLNGGPIPSPAIVNFRKSMDNALQSVGLSLFCTQELRLEPDLARSEDDLCRLGIRIAGQIIHQGKLSEVEEVAGPDGASIRLAPSANGRFIRASRI